MTVERILEPPLAPTTIRSSPSRSTIVGDIVLRGFLPGTMKLAGEGV